VQLVPLSQMTVHKKRVLVAALAAVGAGLMAVNPGAPTLPEIQHRAVQLTAGELDWSQVVAESETNLQTLEGEAATASSDLSSALNTEFGGFGTQITSDFADAETGVQQAISGGWYGDDDGFVFGLFPGSLTDPDTGVTETGSTLQEISTALDQGNLFNAFAYFDTFTLEAFDHVVQPLIEPLLTDTNDSGVTMLPVPGELLQLATNVYDQLFSYDNVVTLGNAGLSPELSAVFALTSDLDTIGTEFSSGDSTQGLSDLSNLSSDVTGALLNGFVQTNPVDGSSEPFTGLLNTGSVLYELLVDGPTQLATALGESTASASAESVSTALPDLLSGLF
jgi:hypothetical protein